jgi:hypothetical protein
MAGNKMEFKVNVNVDDNVKYMPTPCVILHQAVLHKGGANFVAVPQLVHLKQRIWCSAT